MAPERNHSEAAYGLANESISGVSDQVTREALMAVRSETYHVMDRVMERHEELRKLIFDIAKQIQSHVDICTAEKRAEAQWHESMKRLFEGFAIDFKKHLDKDEAFEGKVVKDLNGMRNGLQRWLIMMLLGMLGSVIVALSTVLYNDMKSPHYVVVPPIQVQKVP